MTRPEYRLCATLGDDHKHWLRAKFFQQYRLFFRYHAASKLIVYAWVNDEVPGVNYLGRRVDSYDLLPI
jgi:toxin YhaV